MFDLPSVSQEVFPRSPLAQVICQVQYPTVLKIVGESPVQFQECVRSDFSRLHQQQKTVQVEVLGHGSQQRHTTYNWRFSNPDQTDILTLAASSLSYETTCYSDFKTFCGRFQHAMTALHECYQPEVCTRVGLRYINQIARLGRQDWYGWINEELMPKSMLGVQNDAVASSAHAITLAQNDGTSIIRYGLTRGTMADESAESLVLDIDYATRHRQETRFDKVVELLTGYNDWIYRLFRWAIGDELLTRMRRSSDGDDDGRTFYGIVR